MDNNIDYGNIPSKNLGDLLPGELVRLGKEALVRQNSNIDYGNISSKTLPKLGKKERNKKVNY